jgi:lysyl-tRNA synthetase class 2
MEKTDMKTVSRARSNLYTSIRNFFNDKDYLEVDTPTLSGDLIPEPTIENFATQFSSLFEGSRELYLIPSPEIFMKKLIAQGSGSIYQFSHCFRNSEQLGREHNIEFSMLEYYSVGMDEQDSISLTEELLAKTHLPQAPEYTLPPFRHLTMEEAMKTYAGVDLDHCQRQSDLVKEIKRLGLEGNPEGESWEESFNRIFLSLVEPNLPKDKPLVLDRYPMQIDCLAADCTDGPYKKRWEMYIAGNEVANCYDEMRNVEKIRAYYRKESAVLAQHRLASGSVLPDTDPSFADIFATFPQCSGVAIGMDRLLMCQLEIEDIRGVILFPFSAMI